MLRTALGTLLALTFFGAPRRGQAGELDDAGRQTMPSRPKRALPARAPDKSEPKHLPARDPTPSYDRDRHQLYQSHDDDDDDTIDDPEDLAAWAAFYVVTSPFTVPHWLLEDGGELEPTEVGLAGTPFENGECGFYCPLARSETPRWVGLNLALEGGFDPDGVALASFGFDLTSHYRVGLSTRLTAFREELRETTDYALLGKSHFTIRFAESPFVQFRAGLGARYFLGPPADSVRDAGFDFLYAFDLQWSKPITSEFEFDVGHVGDAFAAEIRGTVGAWVGPVQFYAGWDQHFIGIEALGGPVFGARFRF